MAKGIIYVMTTVVDGLIKIGKTGSENFEQRMSNLESNGYRNVTGLKRTFAIEVEDYDEKENLLDNLFSRSRVSNTELFSLNVNEVIQLLSSFDGKIIYPPQEEKSEIFENATEAIQSEFIPDGTYSLDVKPRGANSRVRATMIVHDGKMIVQKGASLGNYTRISVSSWREIRSALRVNGSTTLEEFEASSPSMAAAIVIGHNTNGWTTWKNSRGEYIDIYRSAHNSDDSE